MDPRQSLSRTSSSNVPQTSYNPNNMATSYYSTNHLPPINYSGLPPASQQNYMPQQQYRNELPRYPSGSAPAPTPTADRYNSHMASQNTMQGLPPASMLPQPQNQAPQPQNYQTQQPARQTYPQPLAPAPPRPNLDQLSNSYGQGDNRQPAWSGAETMPGMTADVGRDPTRTHVVGSQGRRGILPSAPGRAPVMPNGINGSPKSNQIPAKDADGKFPCPNCTKTYLHAKHLKRHMLRHTGDRPYMCVLCNDTFSRSDILKRHFQKCSVRRGNPTGASHLSNPAAHLKKNQTAAAKAAGTASPASATTPVSSGLPPGVYTSAAMPNTSVPATAAGAPASSMAYAMNNGQSDIQSQSQSQQMSNNQGPGGIDHSNNASWTMHNTNNPQMMYHQNPRGPDHYGMQQSGGDDKGSTMQNAPQMEEWNHMFPPPGNEQYMNPMFAGYNQSQNNVKSRLDNHEGGSNGYYIPSTSLGADGTLGPPLWNLNASQEDPLQIKADQLVDFCFPGGIQESLQEQQNNFHIRSCLTVDAIKHFLDLYPNFQGHFPWLHLPTFNFLDTYNGLILMIICSGAVYSDRVSQSQVRALLQRAKFGIERTSRVLRKMDVTGVRPKFSSSGIELDELLSLLMLYIIMIWHGGPEERAAARNESRKVLFLVRQYDMLTLAGPEDPSAYSYLHNLAPGEQADPTRWNWNTWVEQEKRSRLMFLVFTFDAAMCMYFNVPPSFSASEIKLPLPADDAAWDAPDAEVCAQALGLRGAAVQANVNTSGSLRLKSLECHHAMQVLHHNSVDILPRTTNVYSKFILIHAIHVEIWQLQRQRTFSSPAGSPTPASSPSHSNISQTNNTYKSINGALARWKQCWDEDMALQYPPNDGMNIVPKRLGFCRDGVQFYWLARAFIQPNRMRDWQLPADARFRLAMNGLNKAREWSLSDGAQRGEEPGSVALIDDAYGVSEALVLDMRKLFRPLNEVYTGPAVNGHSNGHR